MKAFMGAGVFLISLILMRRILVGAGVLEPWTAFLFLACAVGISLSGFLFLEASFDAHRQATKREIEELRRELARRRSGETSSAPLPSSSPSEP